MSEVAFGEEVNLDVVDDDSRVALALWVFKAPEFFAVFVGDGDGFAFSRDETACGAGSFNEDGETFGGGLVVRGFEVFIGLWSSRAGASDQSVLRRRGLARCAGRGRTFGTWARRSDCAARGFLGADG